MNEIRGWRKMLLDKFDRHCQAYTRGGRLLLHGQRLAKLASYIYGGAWEHVLAHKRPEYVDRLLYHTQTSSYSPRDRRYIYDVFVGMAHPKLPDELEVRRQLVVSCIQRQGIGVSPGHLATTHFTHTSLHAFNMIATLPWANYENNSRDMFRLSQKYNAMAHHIALRKSASWKIGFLYERKDLALMSLIDRWPDEIIIEQEPGAEKYLLISRPPLGSLHIPVDRLTACRRLNPITWTPYPPTTLHEK